MQNTVLSYTPQDNTLKNYRKEKHGLHRSMILYSLDTGEPLPLLTVRTYWPAQSCFACVWVHSNRYSVGRGKAGGWGYCKESAAIDSALRSAGIELETSVCGVGLNACEEALKAFARFSGCKSYFVSVAHA
jgi:hypothetical protein